MINSPKRRLILVNIRFAQLAKPIVLSCRGFVCVVERVVDGTDRFVCGAVAVAEG